MPPSAYPDDSAGHLRRRVTAKEAADAAPIRREMNVEAQYETLGGCGAASLVDGVFLNPSLTGIGEHAAQRTPDQRVGTTRIRRCRLSARDGRCGRRASVLDAHDDDPVFRLDVHAVGHQRELLRVLVVERDL